MKNILIITILFCSFQSSAQLIDNNLNAIDLNAGYAENGYGGKIAYSRYLNQSKRNDYIQIAALYTDASIQKSNVDLSYNLMALTLGYFYNVPLDAKNKANLNLGIGFTTGLEEINKGEKILETGAELSSTGGLVYGPYAGIELELYLSDKFSFILLGNEYYHINSEIGDFTLYAGGGFRVFL